VELTSIPHSSMQARESAPRDVLAMACTRFG
jgi:hypothetical protein